MLALYHFGPMANSLTPLLCLLEKGLAFDIREWEHHTPEFRRIGPEGGVPVLVCEGRALTASSVIDEYFCPALTVLGAHGAAKFAAVERLAGYALPAAG
jgi:glutathione S-transferase